MGQAPPPNTLQAVIAKLRRAEQHIAKLKRDTSAFLRKAPSRTLKNYEPRAGEAFRDFHRHRLVPLSISVVTGEVIHQLRSSLDHIVYALILRDGGDPTTSSGFPIFNWKPCTKKERRRYQGRIRGIRRRAPRAIIQRYQPYVRGKRRHGHWLGILAALSNDDKHHALILQRTYVDARMETKVRIGSFEIEGVGPDDGIIPTSGPGPDGEFIEVVNVERQLSARVTFDVWGDTGQVVSLEDGLTVMLGGVSEIIDELSPYVLPD